MYAQNKAEQLKAASDEVKAATGQPSKLEQVFCNAAPTAIELLTAIKELATGHPLLEGIDTGVLDIIEALQTHFCQSNPTTNS